MGIALKALAADVCGPLTTAMGVSIVPIHHVLRVRHSLWSRLSAQMRRASWYAS